MDECSNFNVSGYSSPNFIAWNCNAANSDGTVPSLPEIIYFVNPVRSVASNSNAGSLATLVLYDAAFTLLGFDQVILTPAAQTLSVSLQSANAKFALLAGPCVMIADNFRW